MQAQVSAMINTSLTGRILPVKIGKYDDDGQRQPAGRQG
jgi:hypothetical protein